MDTSPSSGPAQIVAFRGNTKLNDVSLQAHMAALLRLEHIGLFLGAGTSLGLGGMTVKQLWDYFTITFPDSLASLTTLNFIKDPGNIEALLDSLQIAIIEAERISSAQLESLLSAQDDLRRAVVKASTLDPNFWKDPFQSDEIPAKLQTHCELLQKLRGARSPGQTSPWIFTPNYDLAIEWAAECVGLYCINGFSGLHNRTFSPHTFDLGLRNVLGRGEARFGCYEIYLAKLHGSLTWLTNGHQIVIERPASSLWPEIDSFLKSTSIRFSREMVFPSAAKYLQTVGFVLSELFRRFTDFLSRPQTALIICGYSFNDDHFNRILLSALQNPTLSLVIYAPEAKMIDNGLDTSNCSSAFKRLVALKSPQVTIVFGGVRAYMDAMVRDLPDPAIFDEWAQRIRRMLSEMREEQKC